MAAARWRIDARPMWPRCRAAATSRRSNPMPSSMTVDPGSPLGGARPKATFRDPDGSLWIAKLPSRTDRRDVAAWEHVYARLAGIAGVDVPETRLLRLAGPQRTFAGRRFDRTGDGRRLYGSASTLTGAIGRADSSTSRTPSAPTAPARICAPTGGIEHPPALAEGAATWPAGPAAPVDSAT